MAGYDPRVYQNFYPSHPGYSHQSYSSSSRTATPTMQPREPPSLLAQDVNPKVTKPGWLQFYRTAQNIAFPEASVACGDAVAGYLEDMARAVGCPLEYVLVPLLPCVGGLLGTNTTIRVHRGWSEPAILWSIVCAGPGTRRSAVIRQVLSPILALQAKRSKEGAAKSPKNDKSEEKEKDTTDDFQLQKRALYSGTRINAAALTEVLHRNDGHAFSLTENVENLHDMLGLLQPVVPPRMVSVMEDLYEGLPLVAVEDGRVTTILGSNFCHGGFSSPEYAVQLMLKSPAWLSSRLLLSCPQTDDMKGVFGEPASDSQQPDLTLVYAAILVNHESPCTYNFSADALQELSRFFDEEWSSVLNQLDQNEHEGIIGKSMGQIVRISAVIKALDNGIKSTSHPDTAWDWEIDMATICCAISLGKYFMEQKLAMTFNVGTEFFSGKADKDLNGNGRDFLESDSLASLGGKWGVSQNAVRDGASTNYDASSPKPGKIAKTSLFESPGSSGQTSDFNSLPQNNGAQQTLDVDFSVLPQAMSTPEQEMSEMAQAVDFVHFSSTQFVAVHGRRIKRLLECYDDGHGVSATTAAQKSITPPVRLEGTNNRHPAWASALFFQKVAELQLGAAEHGRHPTNRKVCWRFKRKPPYQLSDKNNQLIEYLRVDIEKYSMFGPGQTANRAVFGSVPAGLLNSGPFGVIPGLTPEVTPAGGGQANQASTMLGVEDDAGSQHSGEGRAGGVKAEMV